VDCHQRADRDRLPVLHRRTELPLLHGLDSFFVEPKPQAAPHLNTVGDAVGLHFDV